MSDNESVDYLQGGFDPKSLTVPRLRSILVAHNVQYPSTAKKPQLIDLFNEHVVPQSKKILAARARVKRMSKGIVDADSQESASMDDHDLMPPPTVSRARSPRKSTRLKSESVDPEPEPGTSANRESPRKRQSRSASAQAVGVSDTDSTDADATRSTRKPRRVITATTPPVKLEPPREESFFKRTPETEGVFSSDNPFQSGGSSPPAPSRTPSGRRKTTGPEAAKTKTQSDRRRTDGPFDSDLYRSADQVGQRLSGGPIAPQLPVVEAGEEFTPEAQLELQQEEARHPQRALLARAKLQPPAVRTQKSSLTANALSVLLPVLLAVYAIWYRQEKLAVGYCGLGRAPTPLVNLPENVELPDWAVALVEPQCEPCPPHAYCYEDFSVRCEQDFILKPHPLSLGGLVPLPPTCEPDGEKVRRVQTVADRAVEELRDRRAKYECGESLVEEGPAVDSPAIDEEELKEAIAQKRSKRMSKDEFDDLWTAAIGEIKARDEVEVVQEEQPEASGPGHIPPARSRLSSSSLARLPIGCAVRRSVKLGVARHRVGIGSLILAVLSALYGRSRYRSHRKTAAQIPGLVDVVLERLAAQKELAFEDGSDDPFLFLPNLRDDVLRSRHSLAERERVWAKVRAVVEQNSNVRTGQREGRNGEVGRAWEWIGPTRGAITDGGSGRRRKSGRVSWGPDVKGEDEGEAYGKEVVKGVHKSWEEGRPIY